MERTLESLQRVLIGGNSNKSILPLIGIRKRFDEFVDHTRFAFSKHEEDTVVRNKLTSLQNRLSQPGISLDEVEDCLLYAMYCETIGYSCSFAYIHSLKLAEQGNLHQKMIGYLAAIVFLHQHHELVVLLINTIQKDVKSSNVIEACLALNTICYLVSSDMVPSVQCLIEEKLNHSHPLVRRSAILALQHCLMQSQNWHISLATLPRIEKALMDRDLSVVSAAVTVLKELIKKEPKKFIHLIPSLVQIQDQLIHRKVSKDFEYHTIPSPWLQIQILRLLAVLGRFDKGNVAKIYTVVKDTLQRAEVSQNVAYAITFECIETIVSLQHNSDEVLHVALSSITKLLKSKCANLKFMGIKALSHVATKIHPQFATQHQEIVMECLHHPDSSMRLQTLDLLYAMANPSNVQVICKKMLEYLDSSCDTLTHQIIVNRIAELAVQYCSDDAWFITTTSSLFFIAPDNVPANILYQLIEKIKTGSDKLKSFAIHTYSEFCEKPKLPFQLIQLASWVLGEMWLYSTAMDSHKAQDNLCNLLEKQDELSEETYLWILSALLKIILSAGSVSGRVKFLVQNVAQNVKFRSVQQKAEEISRIVDSIYETLPLFTQQSEKKIDPTLSFLDAFICEELEKGALPYKQQSAPRPTCFPCPSEKDDSSEQFHFPSEDSPILCSDPHSIIYSPSYHSLGSENVSHESPFRLEHKPTKNLWTREGRLQSQGDSIQSASNSSSISQSHSDEQHAALEQEKLCKELFAGVSDISAISKDSTKENSSSITNVLQTVNTSNASDLSFIHDEECSRKAQQHATKSADSSCSARTMTFSKQSGMSLLQEFAHDFEIQLENNKSKSHQSNRES